MSRTPSRTAILVIGLALAALLATTLPALAQTADVWTNTKISDLRRHQQAISSEASEHYETAQRYLVTIDRLTKEDELSARQEKKLDRAYRKATQELRDAVKAAPDWIDARMALAAVLYKTGELEPAASEYQEILARDPENTRAESYLATVRYEQARQERMSKQEPMDEDSGGR